MKNVDLYGRVRHAVLIDGMSSREAARVFGVDPRTIAKMLAFSFPPGYRRSQPVRRPKLDAFTGIIDQTLEADGRVASITGQARSTLTRENGQPTDSNLAQPSSVILLRARTPICASVF